jgi:hypothetical protein
MTLHSDYARNVSCSQAADMAALETKQHQELKPYWNEFWQSSCLTIQSRGSLVSRVTRQRDGR